MASDFALSVCHSLAEAHKLLAEDRFDLILCGVNFDESRMFELLDDVKANPATKALPFVCIKVFQSILHAGSYDSVKKAGALLGVATFIDLAQWRKEIGREQADAQLRSTLHQVILEASGTH